MRCIQNLILKKRYVGPCNLSTLFAQYRHLQTMYLRKLNPCEYFESKKTLVARQITEILHIESTKIVQKS